MRSFVLLVATALGVVARPIPDDARPGVGSRALPVIDPVMERHLRDYGVDRVGDEAARVEVFRLGEPAGGTPARPQGLWVGPHPVVGKAVTPAARWSDALRRIVLDARSYEWRWSKDCLPTPGILVRFHVGDAATDLLLCFACDMLAVGTAVGSPDVMDERVLRWVDFDPVRADLLALVKELFPDDGVLQGLSPTREASRPDAPFPEEETRPAARPVSLHDLPDARLSECPIEAWCSLALAPARVPDGRELDREERDHLFELLSLACFERSPGSGEQGEPALVIDLPARDVPPVPAHRLVVSGDLERFSIHRLGFEAAASWTAAPAAAPYWRHFLIHALGRSGVAPSTRAMDPRHGVWRDWINVWWEDLGPEIRKLLDEDVLITLCDATRATLAAGNEPLATARMPDFHALKQALVDPRLWSQKKLTSVPPGGALFVVRLDSGDAEDRIELLIDADGSGYALRLPDSPPDWFRNDESAQRLRRCISDVFGTETVPRKGR